MDVSFHKIHGSRFSQDTEFGIHKIHTAWRRLLIFDSHFRISKQKAKQKAPFATAGYRSKKLPLPIPNIEKQNCRLCSHWKVNTHPCIEGIGTHLPLLFFGINTVEPSLSTVVGINMQEPTILSMNKHEPTVLRVFGMNMN